VKDRADEPGPRPTIYLPFDQAPTSAMVLVLKTDGPPLGVAAAARAAVYAVDETQPVTDVRTMEVVVAERLGGLRIAAGLMAAFALLALVLAAVGIYGVIATLVAQRTHEIGVRLALGAQQRDVLRLVLGKGLLLTVVGVALGLAGGAGLLKLMMSVLPPSLFDAGLLVFAVLPAVVAAFATLGSMVPAVRASRVDPLVALRHD
jgi:putative ABC transport system permease protein